MVKPLILRIVASKSTYAEQESTKAAGGRKGSCTTVLTGKKEQTGSRTARREPEPNRGSEACYRV